MSDLEVSFGGLLVTDVPPLAGLWLDEDGIDLDIGLVRTRAPESAYVRPPLLAIRDDIGEIALTIYARGATAAALQGWRETLAAAASPWSYDLTVTIHGVTTVYPAEVARPVWTGSHDSGMARAHLDRAQLVIPVNP